MIQKGLLFLFFALPFANVGSAQDKISYAVPKDQWEEKFGNHRAVIKIDKPSDAVSIDFLWRRHDADPEKRRMIVINSFTGEEVLNIFRIQIDNERCKLVFGPVKNTGSYYFYYLPYSPVTKQYNSGEYLQVENGPDSLWVRKHQLAGGPLKFTGVTKVPVSEIQARTEFHSFYPMEVVATEDELNRFLNRYRDDYLVFAEDRSNPIKMPDAIPLNWIQKIPGSDFNGKAKKNEYYALQIGIYAAKKQINNVKLEFSDLISKGGSRISREAFTCFNTDGVDINGKPFTKKVFVKLGKVQALWVGCDIAVNATPGIYEGVIIVKPENLKEQRVKVILTVEDDFLADRGDGEPWRHSRLRWLNSTLGIDDEPVAPYTSLVIEKQKISCLGRSVQLNNYGLPEVINCLENNILASPIKFTVEINNRIELLSPGKFDFKKQKNGIVTWESTSENSNITLICKGEMEFDGRLSYNCQVISKTDIHVQDIRIELPLKKDFATYMMGMGRMGGFTPKNHLSRWLKTEDSFWIGAPAGGIQCELRGGTYHGPLRNLYQPNPSPSWFNGMNGGFRIDTDDNVVTASAYSGARKMTKGQSVNYEFALLITPVKELNLKSQFNDRYFHSPEPTPEVVANGGKIMNVHHANKYNPYINYPFIATKEMRGLVDQWHEKGWKVKIYYTVRELSNHLTEIWALRSLGFEVLADGNGVGYQWLREHLVNNYTPQWYTHLGNGEVDAAILNSGESRWYNYYIEGLAWLVKNVDIDGLYLDDVSFDRRILKRMRKVLEMNKPGVCMIDLHSNTAFSLGSANQNMELFPYIDKTWFGEGFNFDLMPADFWLTEVSGVPFGVVNDILMHMSVNNRRGMTYGMTHRGFVPMWKLWDQFGIADSKMQGYWEKNPIVTLDQKNVYATTYLKDDKVLIAIGSWTNDPVKVKMNIDWGRLNLKPDEVKIVAPEIDNYQKERLFKIDEPIPIDPKGDCLIIISKK